MPKLRIRYGAETVELVLEGSECVYSRIASDLDTGRLRIRFGKERYVRMAGLDRGWTFEKHIHKKLAFGT